MNDDRSWDCDVTVMSLCGGSRLQTLLLLLFSVCFILAGWCWGGVLTRLPVVNIMCLCPLQLYLLHLPEQKAPSSHGGAPAPPPLSNQRCLVK